MNSYRGNLILQNRRDADEVLLLKLLTRAAQPCDLYFESQFPERRMICMILWRCAITAEKLINKLGLVVVCASLSGPCSFKVGIKIYGRGLAPKKMVDGSISAIKNF